MDLILTLSEEFKLTQTHTKNIVSLIDEGNTIPFIARYRKEMTGNCDDQVLRELFDRLTYLRNLQKRKEEVKGAIEEQGKMTDEIAIALEKAVTLMEVEDIYRPYKQKKKTRASVAIAKGLEPFAKAILLQNPAFKVEEEGKKYLSDEVATVEDAVLGAKDIIAEYISDDAKTRKKIRNYYFNHGELTSSYQKGKEELDEEKKYELYKSYSEPISSIKSHRVLAINRGEKEEFLKVSILCDTDFAIKITCGGFVKEGGGKSTELVKEAGADSYKRLIAPSVEREVRGELFEKASEQAIKMFELNLKPLLMQPPIKDKVTLGWDPGYRTGCKICVVDGTGKVLDHTVVHATLPNADLTLAKNILKKLIAKHGVEVISCGNGTASKESEIFIANLIKEIKAETGRSVGYVIVNEAGASVYSASPLAKEEFPDYDVTTRSAVSIARRLQDPLAELIKIDPKSIGVGQYQHDMNQKRLDETLTGVLEDCVNSVGVDLNTASVSLLRYVAGLNSSVAKNIVSYREENGRFTSRRQLLKVPKLGEKAFVQCAGFLRIDGGKDILDNTAVHPEFYQKAEKLLSLFSYTKEDVKKGKIGELRDRIKAYGDDRTASEIAIDKATMMDIVTELMKPGRDIRDSLPQPILRQDIMSMEDLKSGMQLSGTVRNVVDFGAFIDIGVHQDGLVHISEITEGYIRHPSEALKVGQVVTVWIKEVDLKKKRIALTMKKKK